LLLLLLAHAPSGFLEPLARYVNANHARRRGRVPPEQVHQLVQRAVLAVAGVLNNQATTTTTAAAARAWLREARDGIKQALLGRGVKVADACFDRRFVFDVVNVLLVLVNAVVMPRHRSEVGSHVCAMIVGGRACVRVCGMLRDGYKQKSVKHGMRVLNIFATLFLPTN
jgi:hypothetical protein